MAKADITGGMGAVPPPGAPQEVAVDLSDEDLAKRRAVAEAHRQALADRLEDPSLLEERSLRPLTYDQPGESLAPKPSVESSAERNLQTTLRLAAQQRAEGREPNRMPAESDTDSPSRGMPQPSSDPGKQITGGFGEPLEAQYFALDGHELKLLVQKLLRELSARLENDLRFHVAITYPRVRVIASVAVDGWAAEAGFHVEHGMEHLKTPIDVALAAGAEPVTFEEVAMRREFDDEDRPENPPDRIRDELGIEKPRKQAIYEGGRRQIVDRVADLGDSF
jgi:hypothetical protein